MALTSAIALLVIGLSGGASAAGDDPDLGPSRPSRPGDTTTASLLFVSSASGGTLAVRPDAADVYDLTLTGVAPETLWFTDRPERQADTAATADALEMIGFGPKETPPNAVIDVKDGPNAHDAFAVKLEDPKYDAAAATLSFTATALPRAGKGSDVAGFSKRLDPGIADAFGPVSLFIDDADTVLGPDGTPDLGSYQVYGGVTLSLGGPATGQSFVYDSWSVCSLGNNSGPFSTTKDHEETVIQFTADEGVLDGCFSSLSWTEWEFHVTSPVDGWFRLSFGQQAVGSGSYELTCDVQPYPSRRTLNCKKTGGFRVEITG